MSAIKEKILKLLAVANNSGATEAEASTAMELASALMMKHNIEIDPESSYEVSIGAGPIELVGFNEPWHEVCSSASAMLYTCQNVTCLPLGKGFYFVGRKDNCEAAMITLAFIIQQIERLYKEHLPKGLTKSQRAEFRRTFKYSCAQRVLQRCWSLRESFKRGDDKAVKAIGLNSLVIIQSTELMLKEAQDFCEKTLGPPNQRKSHNPKVGSGTIAGWRAGDTVQLHKKVG